MHDTAKNSPANQRMCQPRERTPMAIHSLQSPVESHRGLAKRKQLLALGVVLPAGMAAALAFPFSR